MKIVIVIPNGELVLSSISGSYKLFKAAISENNNGDHQLIIAGHKKPTKLLDGLFYVRPEIHWREIEKCDLIIVPAIKQEIEEALTANSDLMNWLCEQYTKGAHVASLCTGSFLLAEAGLLDGKRCTTHWLYSSLFNSRYENKKFSKNNIITEDQRIYTSGGAYSFLNLIVYLIEVFFDKETSLYIAGIFEVDYGRSNQDQFIVFNSQKSHLDDNIKRAQDFLETNYDKKISNHELADVAMLGERTMVRRFKELTGNTPNEYLQRVRTEAAKELLTNTDHQISQIQYAVGYNDSKTFREIFFRHSGCTPMEYRKKYSLSRMEYVFD